MASKVPYKKPKGVGTSFEAMIFDLKKVDRAGGLGKDRNKRFSRIICRPDMLIPLWEF